MTATARAAAIASGAGLLAALAFLPRGCAEDATAPPAAGPEVARNPAYFPSRAAPPPLRIDEVDFEPALVFGGDGDSPEPPCDGCLPEAGAVDVAETFLYHMRNDDHIGVRAELYFDIAARLEAAGLPPPHETRLPKLPPGLVDAPPGLSMGDAALPKTDRPGETWVVWVHVGGFDVQSYISTGTLPPAAASWPPLKYEKPLLVDARSGEVWHTEGLWPWNSLAGQDLDAYGDLAHREAATRAEHWLKKGAEQDPR